MTAAPIGAMLLFALPLAGADIRQLNIDSFEQVWTAVRDRHWDPKLGGLDWQKVHEELRPRMEKAATVEEARAVLSDMLKRLGHSHMGIIPAETYGQMDSGGRSQEGVTGIEVRAISGAALVVSVQSGSPAAAAGVRPGWEIRKIDGREIPPALAQAPAALRGKTWEPAYLAALVMNRLSGPPATSVDVEFRQDGGRTASLAIGRARPRGILGHLGFLPPFYVWTETRRLPGDVGYFAFNAFLDPVNVMAAAEKAITSCLECDGFIIDIRGNGGGLPPMAMGLAGWFVEKPGRLGTLYLRRNQLHLAVEPRADTYNGPLAILVDGSSASCSEIFAGGMQGLKRARIFGSRTAGAALPAQIEKLPNGDGFMLAIADYISEGGRRLEGAGVQPDTEVVPTREALLAGRDPVIEAALAWIQEQRR